MSTEWKEEKKEKYRLSIVEERSRSEQTPSKTRQQRHTLKEQDTIHDFLLGSNHVNGRQTALLHCTGFKTFVGDMK